MPLGQKLTKTSFKLENRCLISIQLLNLKVRVGLNQRMEWLMLRSHSEDPARKLLSRTLFWEIKVVPHHHQMSIKLMVDHIT